MGMTKSCIEATVVDPLRSFYFKPVTGTITLYLKDYLYRTEIIIDSSSIAGAIYLPNPAEAKGIQYSFMMQVAGNAVVIYDNDDSDSWGGDYTLDAANESVTLVSDGRRWIEVQKNIA